LPTICLGWLWASILLIFAFWVARIIGMCHRYPAVLFYFWDRILLTLPRLASNFPASCLHLASNWDYRHALLCLAQMHSSRSISRVNCAPRM
jgi:hypothetical protein